jgi:hypothetical protein
MAKETREESLGRWRHLTGAVEENASELQEIVGPARRLAGVLNEAGGIISQQAQFRANKQQASQRIQDLMSLGQKLATLVETGLRERYGNRSEKLAEFKIQPFRGGRRRVIQPPPPEVPAVAAGEGEKTTKE